MAADGGSPRRSTINQEEMMENARLRAYEDECMQRRGQIENMLLKDPDDRTEEQVNLLAEFLEREFPFFKELSRETADEAKFVSKIAKDHLTMIRTFEQRSLIEEGQFINREGIYMVFDGFCGIYQ